MTDPSVLLGEKLLQGWTMLEEGCNTCDVPLMRKRGSMEDYCVVCGKVEDVKVAHNTVDMAKEEVYVVKDIKPKACNQIGNDNTANAMNDFIQRASQKLCELEPEDPKVEQIGKNIYQTIAALEKWLQIAPNLVAPLMLLMPPSKRRVPLPYHTRLCTCHMWFMFCLGCIGFLVIWESGKDHFYPPVSICHEDYSHVPMQFIPLHKYKSYSLYYFQSEGRNESSLHGRTGDPILDVWDHKDVDWALFGIPVLFIPGHAGQFRQGKGISSTIYHLETEEKRHFDVFGVDFNVELSIFHGDTLHRQANYVMHSIDVILQCYKRLPIQIRPTSVILVGHSMGGVVARLAVMKYGLEIQKNSDHSPELDLVDSKYVQKVETIITLGTPHLAAPWPMDESVSKVYQQLNSFYVEHSKRYLRKLIMVSLSGGLADNQVPAELSDLPADLFIPSRTFYQLTTSIPSIRSSVPHQKLTRCKPLLDAIGNALYDIIDTQSLPGKLIESPIRRIDVFRSYLSDTLPSYLHACTWDITTIADYAHTHTEDTTYSFLHDIFPISKLNENISNYHEEITLHSDDRNEVNIEDYNDITRQIKTCQMMEDAAFSITRNSSAVFSTDLCWQLDPSIQYQCTIISSITSFPESLRAFHTRTNRSSSFFQGQPIRTIPFNGTFFYLGPNNLQEYDILLFSVQLFASFWPDNETSRSNHFIIFELKEVTLQDVSIPLNNHVPAYEKKIGSPLTHFQFPYLTDKHQQIQAFIHPTEEKALFLPFFYQVTQTQSLCESKFTQRRTIRRNGTTHSLDFHQSSPLLFAPHLYLFSDPSVPLEIDFTAHYNFVQYFRSYARFLSQTGITIPILVLSYSLWIWAHYGVFPRFFVALSNLVIRCLLPTWMVVVLIHYFIFSSIVTLPLQVPDLVERSSDLIAFLDDDVILHNGIPFSSEFLFIASICTIGWVLTWSILPWCTAVCVRKIYFFVKGSPSGTKDSSSEDHKGSSSFWYHYWLVFAIGIACFCIIQPLLCLAFCAYFLFLRIISGFQESNDHLHYQLHVLVITFLVCAWKFACLFTGIANFTTIHPFDLEWVIILPLCEICLFSSLWMIPRTLHQFSWLIHIPWFVLSFSFLPSYAHSSGFLFFFVVHVFSCFVGISFIVWFTLFLWLSFPCALFI